MKIVLDLKKTLEQNANDYFEKAKKARKKLEGAKKAVEDARIKRASEAEKVEQVKNYKIEKKIKRAKKWYEKFRWFKTSEGFLCIGGRDATTNEIIIKKRTGPGDIICHTDMSGSPFFVIKKDSNPSAKITDVSIQEAIDATFAFSRAWKLGLMTTETFWVIPEQVTKEANAGEFLPKGAFMIRGKTNYVAPRNRIAIGLYEDTVMAGPYSAIETHCEKFLQLERGDKKPSDVAKKIRHELGETLNLDDIISALPPGNSDVKKPDRTLGRH